MLPSRLQQRKLRAILYYLAAWQVMILLYVLIRYGGMFWNGLDGGTWLQICTAAFQFALLTGISQGTYEILIMEDNRSGRRLPEILMLRTLNHVLMILANAMIVALLSDTYPSRALFHPGTPEMLTEWLEHPDTPGFLLFSLVNATLVTFFRTVHKKFGTRVLLNSLLGKYQDPIEEDRVFLFLDLKSATTLAETLGNARYSAFLRDYFDLVSNICAENLGEVYQFAGDGVILTWTVRSCRRSPKPLQCWLDLRSAFRKTQRKFEKRHGTIPVVKAAAHCGKVVATEVGNFGSELAYHGDPLNTTARLQSLCNLLKQDFLVTETMLKNLPHMAGCQVKEHGCFQLKGKKADLEVYSILPPPGK